MTEIVLNVGDEAYKDGRYSECGTVVTITGKTAGGNYKASDGNIYYAPKPMSNGSGDWYMSQRGGGTWSSGGLRRLTQERSDSIEVAALLRKCEAIRSKVGGADYRSCSKAQAARLLMAWQMVQNILEDIKQPKKADA